MTSIWKLQAFARTIFGAKTGSITILLAVSLPILLGIIGVAAESAVWFELKRRAQTAADAAAVAGAIQRARGDSTNVLTSAARAATQNGFTTGTSDTTVIVNYPPTSGAYAGQPDAVEVSITRTFAPLISKLFHASNYVIHARAVAEVKVVGQACVLALNTTASNALYFQGSTIVNNAGCVVAANSSSSSAVAMSGNATLTAESVWSAGGFTTPNSLSQLALTSPAKTNMWALDDPYSSLSKGSVPTCAAPYTSQYKPGAGTYTLSPGSYCGGIKLTNGVNITLGAGVYYINGGSLEMTGGVLKSSGDGVTIVLTNTTDPTTPADIKITGGTSDLKAPTSDSAPFKGMLIFQDGTSENGNWNKLNGGSGMQLRGAIYFPKQNVEFTGDNSTTANTCVMLVANKITFIGNSTIYTTGCDDAGVEPVQVKGVRLRE